MVTPAKFEAMLGERRISARQWLLVTAVLLILIIDGLDIQLLSFVAPDIIEEFGSARAEFGIAMSAALVGMAIGSGLGGYMGDRIGKRTVLIAAMVLFGSATILAAMTDSVPQMAAVRVLSGIGFGAASPTGIALASEWLPARARSRVAALFSVGVPVGGLVGASTVLLVLDDIGWRGCFVVCGLITFAIAIVCLPFLPQSIAELFRKGRFDEAERQATRIVGSGLDIKFLSSKNSHDAMIGPSERLFAKANLRLNLGVWSAFFAFQLIAYACITWATVFLTQAGFTLGQAVTTTFAFNLCAVIVAGSAAALISRTGTKVAFLLAAGGMMSGVALMTWLLGTEPATREIDEVQLASLANGLIGGASGFGIATAYALLAVVYPSQYRSTGFGILLSIGRLGAIAASLLGGAVLALDQENTRPLFLVLMAFSLLAAVGALTVDRHLQREKAAS